MAELLTPESLRRLSDADYDIAPGEPDVRGWDVVLTDRSRLGDVNELIVDIESATVRYLDVHLDRELSGSTHDRHVLVPISRASLDTEHEHVILGGMTHTILAGLPDYDGTRFVVADDDMFPSRASHDSDTQRLTRSAEELRIGKRVEQTGEVRVSKHVETEHVREDVPLQRERVHVERRPADQTMQSAPIGEEEIVIPVSEEEVVVEKRPVVKEEVVITKRPEQTRQTVETDLRREDVDVEPSSGDVAVDSNVKPRGGK